MVEVVYGGGNVRWKPGSVKKGGGPFHGQKPSNASRGSGGENYRGERQREGTRRNQSGSVARSRGEERGPTCRTATHCPTHPPAALGRSRFCLPIQETLRDTIVKMREMRSYSTPFRCYSSCGREGNLRWKSQIRIAQ